ncbi:hypothetical protein PoB_003970800 [Plakobranchus ocellatus]|uniref:Uncharacterized protein n=1 Tax=Plakobranchus ocellatus TaxID=259542 RepID=A0AAV4B263_9GAST|nr:hypothetical protein PoB_003970800 [Plakobranchus ocellatus]
MRKKKFKWLLKNELTKDMTSAKVRVADRSECLWNTKGRVMSEGMYGGMNSTRGGCREDKDENGLWGAVMLSVAAVLGNAR